LAKAEFHVVRKEIVLTSHGLYVPSIRQHGSDARTNMQGKEKDTYREVKAGGTGMDLN
jgi:hypothetical protein